MNFYFQTGEFLGNDGSSWLDLAVQFLGIVVGAGISILVFELGKRYDREKQTKRLLDLEEYLKTAVDGIFEPLEKQIGSLQKFSDELAQKRDNDYAPQTIVSLHSKAIRWISHEDLHSIFVARKGSDIPGNSKVLQLFNSDLDYIDSTSKSLDEIMNLFMSKKEKYVDEYNSSIKKISQLKDRIYLEYHAAAQQNNQFKYPFFHDLDKLMADWSGRENYMEHDVSLEHFLKPLQVLCRAAQPDHNAFIILNLANDCIYALNNIEALKSFIKGSVDFKIEKLKSVRQNLTAFKTKFWNGK